MPVACDLGDSTLHLRLESFHSNGATREPGPFFLKCSCSTGCAHVLACLRVHTHQPHLALWVICQTACGYILVLCHNLLVILGKSLFAAQLSSPVERGFIQSCFER